MPRFVRPLQSAQAGSLKPPVEKKAVEDAPQSEVAPAPVAPKPRAKKAEAPPALAPPAPKPKKEKKPRPPLTEKQKEVLAKGQAKLAELRAAKKAAASSK